MKTEATLIQIIKPMREKVWSANFAWNRFQNLVGFAEDYGPLDLCPDFQRGHVWTESQKTKFIEAALRGALTSRELTVQFNCANWEGGSPPEGGRDLADGFMCLDGLQRITAVNEWIAGKVKPFGLSLEDLQGTSFDPKRNNFTWVVTVHNFTSRGEMLQHYLDLNSGGTPHSPEEIERVRGLRDAAISSHQTEGDEEDASDDSRPRM